LYIFIILDSEKSQLNSFSALNLAFLPILILSSWFFARVNIASPNSTQFSEVTSNPVSPCITISGMPPKFEATTGSPDAPASKAATPYDSLLDGIKKTSIDW
jgi:hypothetical protein